jgi:hypothetical protein
VKSLSAVRVVSADDADFGENDYEFQDDGTIKKWVAGGYGSKCVGEPRRPRKRLSERTPGWSLKVHGGRT